MKTNPFAGLALAALLAAPASATTFSAFFNNGTGQNQDKNANTYSWQAAYGSSAVPDATLADGDGYAAGVSQGTTNVETGSPGSTTSGFLFGLPAGSGAPGVMLLFTTDLATSDALQDVPNQPAASTAPNLVQWHRDYPEALAGLTVADITRLSVYTRAANIGTTTMRLAVQVDGVWYASEAAFQQTADAFLQQVDDPAVSDWRADIFSPGFLDDDLSDNPLGPLPADGLVTGYGLYADTGALAGTAARVRIDAYQVTTPEQDPFLLWLARDYPGLTGPEAARGADPDLDGAPNVVEFVTGSDPTDPTSAFPPQVGAPEGGYIEFSYRCTLDSLPLSPQFELSTDLVAWEVAVHGENDIAIIIDVLDDDTDLIRVSVPADAPARFGRIVVP